MAVRIKRLVTNLVIFYCVLFFPAQLCMAQEPQIKKAKEVKPISEKKAQRQLDKLSKKRRKHAYKIQDRSTRKRMKKTYRKSMRMKKRSKS